MLGNIQAHEVTPAQLHRFLDAAASDTMARNRYRVLSVLFKFAALQRIVVVNPLAEIKRPSGNRSEPGILTPGEYERLLTTAAAKFPALLPYCAIAGFAGVRRAEMVGMYAGEETLQWADILADKRLIVVRPEVAKTTRRKSGDRRFPPIEDALMHWLEPYRQESGAVVPYAESTFRRHFRALCVEAGVSPGHNALRHSFASYWLARGGKEGVGRLALIMGNSESVARRHYIETLEPGDGDRWFNIRRLL
jgi:integrase